METKFASMLTSLTAAFCLGAEAAELEQSRASFMSSGEKIGVEIFRPKGREKLPAILVLHGAGGMDYDNNYVRQLATAFASSGYATFLVHYFDRTGSRYAGDETIHRHFDKWVATIQDGVSFIAAQREVNATRIATFGYSLGGYLAVAHAAIDPRVAAVVELAGGVDPTYARRFERLPPMLVLHGEEDRRVPVERARELEQVLRRLKTPHEVRLYPGEGHFLSPLKAIDALSRGLSFLEKHLRDGHKP